MCCVQVLTPRGDIGMYNGNKNKKKKSKDSGSQVKESDSGSVVDVKTEGDTCDPASVVSCNDQWLNVEPFVVFFELLWELFWFGLFYFVLGSISVV